METCFFIFGTVTRAMGARRVLSGAGISARLLKRTGRAGCTYGLAIHPRDAVQCTQLLEAAGISYEWERRP